MYDKNSTILPQANVITDDALYKFRRKQSFINTTQIFKILMIHCHPSYDFPRFLVISYSTKCSLYILLFVSTSSSLPTPTLNLCSRTWEDEKLPWVPSIFNPCLLKKYHKVSNLKAFQTQMRSQALICNPLLWMFMDFVYMTRYDILGVRESLINL